MSGAKQKSASGNREWWTREAQEQSVTVSGVGGEQSLTPTDAYSQWALGHGQAYELSQRLPRQAAGDYGYADIITDLDSEPNIVRVSDGSNSDQPSRGAHVVRVPLPARSITPNFSRMTGDVPYTPYEGCDPEQMVIMGVIDDGINICHERFQRDDGESRVDFAWAQDGLAAAGAAIPYGVEVTRGEIGEALHDARGDERVALAKLDFIGRPGEHRFSSSRQRATHGTPVTDLAAGYGPEDKDGLHRRLIAVQLPALAVHNTSGTTLVSFIKTAAQYVFSRALSMSKAVNHPLPVVLNFSFGFGGGPRNGQAFLERVLHQQSAHYREAIAAHFDLKGPEESPPAVRVLPAGNGRLMRGHGVAVTEGKKGRKRALDVNLVVQPGDQTSSYLEVWLPQGMTKAKLKITTPCGEKLKGFSVKSGKMPAAYVLQRNGAVVARLSSDQEAGETGEGLTQRILLAIGATDTVGLPSRTIAAPAGRWRVKVSGKVKSGDGTIHAWVQRDDMPGTNRLTARQAYLDDGSDDAVLVDRENPAESKYIRHSATVSGLATNGETKNPGLDSVVVSGLRESDGSIVPYAGLGDGDFVPPLPEPGYAVIVERSRVLNSVLTAGTVSGGAVALNGTSLAAPQIARQIADGLVSQDVAIV